MSAGQDVPESGVAMTGGRNRVRSLTCCDVLLVPLLINCGAAMRRCSQGAVANQQFVPLTGSILRDW